MIRILYVDDESDLLTIGKIFLERSEECHVDTLTSAKDALIQLEEKTYDAIISDYEMPLMNGIEFLKAVRKSGNLIPFILFTGRGREEVVIQALNEGADFYLQKGGEPKPQFAELIHKIRQAVQHRQAEAIIHDHERLEADILNFLPDATFAIDSSGKVIAWNRAIEEMTGVTAADIMGKGDFEYAIAFYGSRRRILIDLIFESDEVIREQYANIIHENDVLIAETTLPIPKGTPCTLMGKASPLYDRLGTVIGAIESIRDISVIKLREQELLALNEEVMASQEELHGQYRELLATQEELRMNQEQLIEVASTVPGVIYQFYARDDGSMGVNFVSLRAEEVFGFTGEISDFFRWFSDHIDPRDQDGFHRSIDACVSAGAPWTYEGRFINDSGFTIWFEGLSRPIRHDYEVVYNGVFLDITKRKQAELNIRESEEKYRTLVETTGTGYVIIDGEGRVLDANQEYVRMTGHADIGDILGRSVIEWTARNEQEKNIQAVRQCFSEGFIRNFVIDYVSWQGTITPVEINATLLQSGGSIQIHTLCRDISDRKRDEEALRKKAEELHAAYEEMAATEEEVRQNLDDLSRSEKELQESRQMYRAVFENTGTATVVLEQNGIISLANAGFEELSGFSKEEIEGKKRWMEFVVHDDLQRMLAQNRLRMVDEKQALSHYEFRFITRSGAIRDIYLTTGVIPDKKRSIASLLDITDRKIAEKALYEGEKLYRSVIENIQDTYYRSDREGTLILVSPSGATLLGYDSVDEILGMSIPNLYYNPQERNKFLEVLGSDGFVRNYETHLKKKDGSLVYVSTTSHYYYDDSGNVAGVEGIIRDVTGIKTVEEVLRGTNQKLCLLFGLTCHDILNQITVIRLLLDEALESSDTVEIQGYISRAQQAGNQIEKMIGFTREYEKFGKVTGEWLQVLSAITDALNEIDLNRVSVQILISPDLDVHADPIIRKVFSTLIENALRHGGDVHMLKISAEMKADGLNIVIEDDGVGISPDEKEKIFEHGYGKHTGIGLFIVREILSITGLVIRECGEPGKGARFVIEVPEGKFRMNS